MANREKGQVAFDVEGRTYLLVFNVNALCEVEYLLNLSTDRILAALMVSPPLHVVRALLWGGLRQHHPEVDLKIAGDLIESAGGSGPALEKIGEALMSAFPEAEEGSDTSRPQKGATTGIGRRS
ncbi:hypothetical protein [Brevundimonas sp. TWP2-3-4b1]|uniref:hypothetical protein n=1 Tax=Brevundimonas sp. TWP2-3-4b1 TaxID=2804580 RepID=UPI003CF43557